MSKIIATKQETESRSFINLGIVRNNKGEVLMIRRVKPEKGEDGSILTWAFPGGKQKFQESRKEGAEREILLETGYKVSIIKEVSMRSHPEFPVIIVYHLCRLIEPKPVALPSEPWEVAEVRWVKPEDIKGLITTSLDPNVAKELGI